MLKCFLKDFVLGIVRETEPRGYIEISERRFTLRNWLSDYGGQSLDRYLQAIVPGKLEAYFQFKLEALTTGALVSKGRRIYVPTQVERVNLPFSHIFVLLGWPKKLVQVFLLGKPK